MGMVSGPSQSLATHAAFQWINNISCRSTVCHFSDVLFKYKQKGRGKKWGSKFYITFRAWCCVNFLNAGNRYLRSTWFLQISSVKFLQTAAQCIFIVDLNEVGQSQSGRSLTHEGSCKNCLNHKEQLANQQGPLAFFNMFLEGVFMIRLVYLQS